MASIYNLVSSGAIIARAGHGANQNAAASDALVYGWYEHAEGRIVGETRRTWVAEYASVASGARLLLADAASALAASDLINYDMSGYTSRAEAQTMLDYLRDRYNAAIQALKDFSSNTIKSVTA